MQLLRKYCELYQTIAVCVLDCVCFLDSAKTHFEEYFRWIFYNGILPDQNVKIWIRPYLFLAVLSEKLFFVILGFLSRRHLRSFMA